MSATTEDPLDLCPECNEFTPAKSRHCAACGIELFETFDDIPSTALAAWKPVDVRTVAEKYVYTNESRSESFLFSFHGRAGRQEYWLVQLTATVFGIGSGAVASFVASKVADPGKPGSEFAITVIMLMVPAILTTWITIAVQIRRWHDLRMSGFWILSQMIPIIGPLCAVALQGYVEGTYGNNQYGNDPLRPPSDRTRRRRVGRSEL